MIFDYLAHPLHAIRQRGPSRWPADRVRHAADRRLRTLLRRATAAPYYRDLYAGLDLDHIPLTALPTTTKAGLMSDFDRTVTDPAVTRAGLEQFVDCPDNVGKLFLGRSPVCHTSGSQGQPMLVVQERRALDLLFAFQMTRGNAGYRSGPVEALCRLIRPARVAVLISRPGFYPSAWAWRHLPRGLRPYVRFAYFSPAAPDLVDQLNAFRPTMLSATPSALDRLAQRRDELRLPPLTQVTTWSENLTPAARDRIRAAFGAPLLDTYGLGECLFLTNGCPAGGMHVNADWAILEVVDDANNPVPPGETGAKALLTNLATGVQPLIRYEVGDRVRMAVEPCGCGNRLPRIERVEGRSGDAFCVAGRRLAAYPFQHALEHLRTVREWQAEQTGPRAVRVSVELLPGAAFDEGQARSRLAERLEQAGFADAVDVTFAVVPRLEPDAKTGKFRRMKVG